MLVQMVAWGILPASAVAANGRNGESIVICTVEGLKRIAVGSDGQVLPDDGSTGGKTDHGNLAGGHCPLCPIVGGAGLPPPAIAAAPPNRILVGAVSGVTDDPVAVGQSLFDFQARAPPLGA